MSLAHVGDNIHVFQCTGINKITFKKKLNYASISTDSLDRVVGDGLGSSPGPIDR